MATCIILFAEEETDHHSHVSARVGGSRGHELRVPSGDSPSPCCIRCVVDRDRLHSYAQLTQRQARGSGIALMSVLLQRPYRRRMSNRMGIVYSVNEHGMARILVSEDRTAFEGVLETSCSEIISIKGKIAQNTPKPSTSDNLVLMNVYIVDNEAGSSFKVENVVVKFEGQHVSVDNPAVQFSSSERLVGVKAEIEISRWLRPSLVENSKELFVGPMKLKLLASHRPVPAFRRTSLCENSGDIPILEQSQDFLA